MNSTRKPVPVCVASLLRREGQTESCRLQIFTHSDIYCRCHVFGSSALVSVSCRVPSVIACVLQTCRQQGAAFPSLQISGLEYKARGLWSCIFLAISCQLCWPFTFSPALNASDVERKADTCGVFSVVAARCGLKQQAPAVCAF